MILHLVKKDFLLGKKFILIIMGMVIVMPLYVNLSLPDIAGATAFLFTAIFSEMILLQYISMTEMKYPKVEALLCSTPYSRRNIVVAKYLFFFLIFVYCTIVYLLMSLILPGQLSFSLDIILLTFLTISAVYGVYTPVQFKLGAERTKYAFMLILFVVAFGSSFVLELVSKLDLSIFSSIPAMILRIGATLISVLILGVSAWTSVRIYSKREL